jgi:hypothetical protein
MHAERIVTFQPKQKTCLGVETCSLSGKVVGGYGKTQHLRTDDTRYIAVEVEPGGRVIEYKDAGFTREKELLGTFLHWKQRY